MWKQSAVLVLFALVGCSQSSSPPSDSKVKVVAPGVNVDVNSKKGVNVDVPGVNFKVNPK